MSRRVFAGSTLSPYRVCVVMNPALATNRDYMDKVTALVTNFPDQQDEWANIQAATGNARQGNSPVAQISQTLKLESFQQNSSQVLTRIKDAVAQGWQSDAATKDGGRVLQWFQRWFVFVLVALFVARKVWRYFREVEEDDDFADHLTTLAAAYRWVFPVYLALLILVAVTEYVQAGNLFFSLSVLFLASSIRRYYCEGNFADHPRAQKLHLALRLLLAWLGWVQGHDNYLTDLHTWFHWHVFVWVMLALATMVFSLFYNNFDLAEHRKELYFFLGGFAVCGILGGAGGCFFWVKYLPIMSRDIPRLAAYGSPGRAALVCGILACLPLAAYFYRWTKSVSEQVADRTIYDIIFSTNAFSEKIRKQRHLPSVLLLRHWRDHGNVEKAWQTAQAHLFKEARALPVWLFAMETAVLYRRKPDDALKLLARLCAIKEFPHDQRVVAVGLMQGWMEAAGFAFDAASFKIVQSPLQPAELTNQVEQKCREGRFGEAVIMLNASAGKGFLERAGIHPTGADPRPGFEKPPGGGEADRRRRRHLQPEAAGFFKPVAG